LVVWTMVVCSRQRFRERANRLAALFLGASGGHPGP
jgi:hypothetical protein